jgi:hypothetical protein
MVLSWLLTMTAAYYLSRHSQSITKLSSTGPALVGTSLLATATSTGCEIYLRNRQGRWHDVIIHFVSAFILGAIGLSLMQELLKASVLGFETNPQQIFETETLASIMSAVAMGTGAYLGGWNSPVHIKGLAHPLLRILTALSLSGLMAMVFVTRLPHILTLVTEVGPPIDFYLLAILGTAIGSTLNSRLGLWTGTPHSGVRRTIEMLIVTAAFGALAAALTQLFWDFALADLLAETDLRWQSISRIHRYATISWTILGAAYGISKQAHAILTTTCRLIVKLLLVITVLSVAAIGGYVGYAIAQEQFEVTDPGLLAGAAMVSGLAALLILRALYGFFKGIVTSSLSD